VGASSLPSTIMVELFLVGALLFASLARSTHGQCFPSNSLSFRSPVTTAPGLSAVPIAHNLTTPRGLSIDAHGNVLVVERGLGVTAFAEGVSGCAGWLRTLVVNDSALTQGIQVVGNSLYVSTSAEVHRYKYIASSRTVVPGVPDVLVNGIPPDGGMHAATLSQSFTLMMDSELTTRPLLVAGHQLIVSCALDENIDPTARNASSGRSQLRAFTLPAANASATTPQDFFSGTLLAYGIRNPAGFAYHEHARNKLWVVDNGASIDNVTGLSTAFVNDNPADELNVVDLSSSKDDTGTAPFFGFPDCTTLWNPDADPVGDPQYTNLSTGTQFSLHLEASRDDAWCRNVQNNVPPRLSFQVCIELLWHHFGKGVNILSRPTRYLWISSSTKGRMDTHPADFPRTGPEMHSSHSMGASAVRRPLGMAWSGLFFSCLSNSVADIALSAPFLGKEPAASSSSRTGYQFLVQAANLTSCPGTCIRPVGLGFDKDGKLFVSSDSSGEVRCLVPITTITSDCRNSALRGCTKHVSVASARSLAKGACILLTSMHPLHFAPASASWIRYRVLAIRSVNPKWQRHFQSPHN
jgi:glucose/arabinose dehydrogenase